VNNKYKFLNSHFIHSKEIGLYMKVLMVTLCCFSIVLGETLTVEPVKFDTLEAREAMALNTDYMNREYKGMKVHKALAFTTGGLLLLSDAVGAYHFFSMRNQGHEYRNANGYTERNMNADAQTKEIETISRSSKSQTEKAIHTELIALSTICYVATATIELTLPRMDTDSSKFSRPNIHHSLFYGHAALMLANIGLGIAESYALSQGNHNLVQGLGITHMIVGIAAPVIMIGSGIVFKL
jgi:hypothetical protein